MRCGRRGSVARDTTALLIAALLAFFSAAASAHDIPADVRVQMYVRPAGDTLQILARVPLAAMREVDVPRRGAGYLDLARADAALRNAADLWLRDNLAVFEDDVSLPPPRLVEARVSLSSDRSFTSYEDAMAHLNGPPLPRDMDLYWNQQLLDVLFEYPIASDRSDFAIHPRLERLGLQVAIALRFVAPGGTVRAFDLHGDPGLVRLDPRWHQAAQRFVVAGFWHILEGTDHLLFILCLVIPFRRLVPLALIVTAFTIAHSITLISAAFGLAPSALWFPPLIETLIAISILYLAIENIFARNVQRRWIVAFAFGLVHGFGFAFALKENLQFAGSHLLTSLVSFNVGVELGQLAVLLVLVPVLEFLFRHAPAERVLTIILSVLVSHTAWHWMVERWAELRKFPLPALDAAALAGIMRWLIAALVLAALVWLVAAVLRRRMREERKESSPPRAT